MPTRETESAVLKKITKGKAAWAAAFIAAIAAVSIATAPTAFATGPAYFGGDINPTNGQIAQQTGTANDGTKLYTISSSNYGLIAHACRSIGTYKGVSAIVCSDLYAQPDATAGKLDVWYIAEMYCQDGSSYPECPFAQPTIFLERSDGWSAGGTFSACQVGGTFVCSTNSRNFFELHQVIAAGACPEYWTELAGQNDGGPAYLEVPGDVQYQTESDLDTARGVIC